MSQWLDRLRECEKNKNIENLPMSVLSVSHSGNQTKFSDMPSKSDFETFQPMSVMSVSNPTFENKKNKIENILKDAYIPTDKTDIGSIPTNVPQRLEIPALWLNAIETILRRDKPQAISESRWKAITVRLRRLVVEEREFFFKIIEYGWSLEEVFGCHKFAPDVRIDGMGLLMLLGKASIAEIKPRCASLKHKDDGMTTYALGTFDRMCMEHSMLMELP